jgi:hypothetical protein
MIEGGPFGRTEARSLLSNLSLEYVEGVDCTGLSLYRRDWGFIDLAEFGLSI